MTLLDTVLARLGRLLAWAAGLCLSLMLLQVIADVIGRLVFAHPLPSTIEIVAEWCVITSYSIHYTKLYDAAQVRIGLERAAHHRICHHRLVVLDPTPMHSYNFV